MNKQEQYILFQKAQLRHPEITEPMVNTVIDFFVADDDTLAYAKETITDQLADVEDYIADLETKFGEDVDRAIEQLSDDLKDFLINNVREFTSEYTVCKDDITEAIEGVYND